MKIIFVTAGMSGGGTERVISVLANKWVEEGNAITILTTANSTVAYSLDKRITLLHLGERTGGSIAKRIKRIYRMHSVFKEQKDAIICAMGVETNMFTVLATLFLKNPVIISERNDPKQCQFEKIRDIFYKKANRVVCQTYEAETYFNKRGIKQTIVIPNPINPNLGEPYIGKRKKTVVAAGRLTAQKNHLLLIKAFQKFHQAFPEYTLEIYGEGELKEELQKQISKAELDTCAFLKGFSDNLPEEFKDSAMYVLSSDYEGISNSLMEAMAIGIPSISTDCPIGGSAMCIQHEKNGFLVPINDLDALARTMKRVAETEESWNEISCEAIKIKDEFSLDKISNCWINLFKEDYA